MGCKILGETVNKEMTENEGRKLSQHHHKTASSYLEERRDTKDEKMIGVVFKIPASTVFS